MMEKQNSRLLSLFSFFFLICIRSLLTFPVLVVSVDIILFFLFIGYETFFSLFFSALAVLKVITIPENGSFSFDERDIIGIFIFFALGFQIFLSILAYFFKKLSENIENKLEKLSFWVSVYAWGLVTFLFSLTYNFFMGRDMSIPDFFWFTSVAVLFHGFALVPLALYLSLKKILTKIRNGKYTLHRKNLSPPGTG